MPALRDRVIALSFSCALLSIGCGGTNKSSPDMTMTRSPDLTMVASPDLTNGPDMTTRMGITTTVMVGMGGTNFNPATLTITHGDTIHWVWAGNNHNVVSGGPDTATPDNKFCSDPTTPGDCKTSVTKGTGNTFDFKFTQPGTYPYFCRPHFTNGMKGTITVNPQ